jgi:hypothetical protein
MIVSIPSEFEAPIQQQANREGISVDRWLQRILEREILYDLPKAASLQDEVSPEEWIRQFRAWVEGHDRTTPLLSDEAISSESIYPDRG